MKPSKLSLWISTAAMLTGIAAVSCVDTHEKEEPEIIKEQLKAPEAEIVEVGHSSVTLHWEPVAEALSYNVYFSGDEHPEIAIDTLFTISPLAPDTEYTVTVTACPASQSYKWKESAPSRELTFKTSSKPLLDTPKISAENLTTVSFTAIWRTVDKAAKYIYIFDGGEQTETTDTIAEFSSLRPGTEYILKVKAVPEEEYAIDWTESLWGELKVKTNLPEALATPEITVEMASSMQSVISWNEVRNASGYAYTLDGGEEVTTKELSVTFFDLEDDSQHVFRMKALTPDADVYTDSQWAEASFTAQAVHESTVTLSNAVPTDRSIKYTAAISSSAGEFFYTGCVIKALHMKDGEFDGEGFLAEKLAELRASANGLVESGDYATFSEAMKSLLRTKSVNLNWNYSDTYSSTTYVCYAFTVNPKDGEAISGIKTLEVKTLDPDTSGSKADITSALSLVPNVAGLTSDGKNLVRAMISGTAQFKTIKYTCVTAGSSVLSESTEDGIKASIRKYFKSSGSTLSASGITNVNAGKSTTVTYPSLTNDAEYALIGVGITEEGDSLVTVSNFRTFRAGAVWTALSVKNITATGAQVTVGSNLAVVSGKYAVGGVASYDTRETMKTYFETKGTAISDARIESLNSGTGFTMSYNTLSANAYYSANVTMTNAAGDVVYDNLIFKTAQ